MRIRGLLRAPFSQGKYVYLAERVAARLFQNHGNMYRCMICLEPDRLLSEATSATDARQTSGAKLAEVSGIGKPEEFAKRNAEARDLSNTAYAAWDAYRKHLKEYGC